MSIVPITALALGFTYYKSNKKDNIFNWSYRDDIGAYGGIKGYEEMVSEVGTHRGHMEWP